MVKFFDEFQQNRPFCSLAERSVHLAAGCYVDEAARKLRNIDLIQLRKLAEAYKAGWLHNVMARITPLTMRKRDHYLMMADLFIDSRESAEFLLNKFENDLELFCNVAGIHITEHMNAYNCSPELRVHMDLYMDIAHLFEEKFGLKVKDPIQDIVFAPLAEEKSNTFVREFVNQHFRREV